MPYFDSHVNTVFGRTTMLDNYLHDGSVWRFFQTEGPSSSQAVFDMLEGRMGSNSNPDNFILSRRLPYLVNRRIFVGYEETEHTRKRWVWVGRERRPVVHKFRTRRKVFDTVVDVRYKEHVLVSKGQYLKPNYLSYQKVVDMVFPRTILFTVVSSRPGGFTCTLSGSFLPPGGLYIENGQSGFPPSQFSDIIRAGNPNGAENPLSPWSPSKEDLDRCLIKLYAKVRDDLPDYYVMLLESKQLVDTIRGLASTVARTALNIYRLNAKAIGKDLKRVNAKVISDSWLAWFYGIAPVMSDLQKMLENHMRLNRTWRTFSASIELPQELYLKPLYLDADAPKYQAHKRFLRFGVVIDGHMSVSKYVGRLENWQQVAGIAYELTPLSFILDWLVDISTYLNSCTLLDGNIVDSWFTQGEVEELLEEGFPQIVKNANNSWQPVVTSLEMASHSQRLYNRVLIRRTPMNGRLPEMPKPIVPPASKLFEGVSLQRAINLLAILVSQTYGLKDRWSRSYNSDLRKIHINFVNNPY